MPPDPGFIIDAAPFILLAKSGLHRLLTALATETLIPSPVAREILKGTPDDPAVLALRAGFGTRIPVRYIPVAVRRVALLGAGETAVLALGLKYPHFKVVLDDRHARMAADKLGLQKIGCLGLILRAARLGLVPSAKPLVIDLLNAGTYLDNATIEAALAAVGESWP